jgi:hypothetical protein
MSRFQTKLKAKIRDYVKELEQDGEKPESFSLAFTQPKKEKWLKRSHFTKLYDDMFEIIDEFNLDAYELATIFKLIRYVEYETNLLQKDGIALNKTDLIKILGYSENKIEDIIKNLVNKKILSKTKVGRNIIFHMNPYIAFKGEYLNPETESIFNPDNKHCEPDVD